MPEHHPPPVRPRVLPSDGPPRPAAAGGPSSTRAPGSPRRARDRAGRNPRPGRPRGAPAGPRARRACRTTLARSGSGSRIDLHAEGRAVHAQGHRRGPRRRPPRRPSEPVEPALGPHERVGGLDRPRVPGPAAQQVDRHAARLERRGHLAGAAPPATRPRQMPDGRCSSVGAKRWPPRCEVCQVASGRAASSARCSGRPRRAQHGSRSPCVHTAKTSCVQRAAASVGRPAPSASRSRRSASAGSSRPVALDPRRAPPGAGQERRPGVDVLARDVRRSRARRMPSASQRVGQLGRERLVEAGALRDPRPPRPRLLEQQPAVVGHRRPRERLADGGGAGRAGLGRARRSPPRR